MIYKTAHRLNTPQQLHKALSGMAAQLVIKDLGDV